MRSIKRPITIGKSLKIRLRHADTDLKFTLGKPLSQEVDEDHGNVIVPLVLDFKEGGKPIRVSGLANVVLLKNRETWKISAFTFTQQ